MGSNTPLFRKSVARASAAARADAQYWSRGELVYKKLREAIEGGELKPGQRVVKTDSVNLVAHSFVLLRYEERPGA